MIVVTLGPFERGATARGGEFNKTGDFAYRIYFRGIAAIAVIPLNHQFDD